MVSDAALLAAVVLAARGSSDRGATLAALLLGSAGLIVVDHIHFQYNGMMMGLFLSSLLMMAQERCGPQGERKLTRAGVAAHARIRAPSRHFTDRVMPPFARPLPCCKVRASCSSLG